VIQIPHTNRFHLFFSYSFFGPFGIDTHLPHYVSPLPRSFAFLLALLIPVLGGTITASGDYRCCHSNYSCCQAWQPVFTLCIWFWSFFLEDLEDPDSDLARLIDYLAQEDGP
jgi:hypothetical protein